MRRGIQWGEGGKGKAKSPMLKPRNSPWAAKRVYDVRYLSQEGEAFRVTDSMPNQRDAS